MQKYFDSVFGDALGFRPIAGASVTVRLPNGAIAPLFSDNGVTPKANPLTTDAAGYFEFYATDGRYNLTITATGFATQTRTDVILEDPAEASPGNFTTINASGRSTLAEVSAASVTASTATVNNGFSVLAGLTSVQSLTATSVVTMLATGNKVAVTGLGSTLTISPASLGAIDNVTIGSVTPAAATFTTVAGNGAALTNLNAANIATGTLSNARTTAVSASTANTIVLRDASGNFSAGTITATLNGLASSATNAVNTEKVLVVDDTTTNTIYYPVLALGVSGNQSQKVSSTKLGFNPSTGALSATAFSGNGAALTALSSLSMQYVSPVPYVQSDSIQNMITKLLVLAKVIPESVPFVDANFNDPAY